MLCLSFSAIFCIHCMHIKRHTLLIKNMKDKNIFWWQCGKNRTSSKNNNNRTNSSCVVHRMTILFCTNGLARRLVGASSWLIHTIMHPRSIFGNRTPAQINICDLSKVPNVLIFSKEKCMRSIDGSATPTILCLFRTIRYSYYPVSKHVYSQSSIPRTRFTCCRNECSSNTAV